MTVGLDLGNTEFRSLRVEQRRLLGRRCATHYVAVPTSPVHQRLLESTGMAFSVCDDQTVVYGPSASEFGRVCRRPISQVMPECGVAPDDRVAQQLLSIYLERLLPSVAQPGLCVVTMPEGIGAPATQHRFAFFLNELQRRQIQVLPISAAYAVGLAELSTRQLTGAALTLGASRCELSVLLHGREMANAVVYRGSNWIDEELARTLDAEAWDERGVRFWDLDLVRQWKESAQRDISEPTNDDDRLLRDRYRTWLRYVLKELGERIDQALATVKGLPDRMPLVMHGGPTQMGGFLPVLREILAEIKPNVGFEQMRVVRDATWTAARGALICAQLEEQVPARAAA